MQGPSFWKEIHVLYLVMTLILKTGGSDSQKVAVESSVTGSKQLTETLASGGHRLALQALPEEGSWQVS